MPVPHASGAFGDLLDPLFQRIFNDRLKQLPDMISRIYAAEPTNGRETMKWSEVGTVPDFIQSDEVEYQSQSQGYDTTMTPLEFTNGIKIKRKLYDDEQYNIMSQRPKGLATSAVRTRQKHAARPFNNAFSVDTYFYNNSEGVALCSNSHTTTSGASTASGFDNLTTAAFSATALASARIQMVNYRGDQAERISVMPDEILYPPNLYDRVHEVVKSSGKPDSGENNDNVHKDSYTPIEWNYLTDTNNWFLCDSAGRQENLFWSDRIPLEFAMVEDFDTFVAKWRAYMRYGNAWVGWRWILGAQVS